MMGPTGEGRNLGRPAGARRPVAEITQWSIVEVDGANHLVGILLGGHPHLPAGHWIITSPIVEINEAEAIAITASTGRVYCLRERLSDALPIEAHKLIAWAPQVWRARAEHKAELARRAAERETEGAGSTEGAGPDAAAPDEAARGRGDAP